MQFPSEVLLQRLNETGLWRNPTRLRILSSELGISVIALKNRMRRRGLTRGPYVIDDQEHCRVVALKRSQLLKGYAEMTGDPGSKVKSVAKKFEITERSVRAQLEGSCGHQWYRREFDTATFDERTRLVRLLNRNSRWKSGGVVKAVAKELGVSKASLQLRMSRWFIVRGPYVELSPLKPRTKKSEEYARAFEQGRGEPATRIRQIAKKYGVRPSAVRTSLKRFWGPDRYQKRLPIRHNPEALLALMNAPKIQKSADVVGAAARRLGIKKQSLMSILSRKGIRRGPKGRYANSHHSFWKASNR